MGTYNKINRLNKLIIKKNSIFALRATFTCSRAAKFSFAGCIPFKNITCSRAADLPFKGRSLPTPDLNDGSHFYIAAQYVLWY